MLRPWHLHRHARLWDDPDGFDPGPQCLARCQFRTSLFRAMFTLASAPKDESAGPPVSGT